MRDGLSIMRWGVDFKSKKILFLTDLLNNIGFARAKLRSKIAGWLTGLSSNGELVIKVKAKDHENYPNRILFSTESTSYVSTRGEYENNWEKGYVSNLTKWEPNWGPLPGEDWADVVKYPFLGGTFPISLGIGGGMATVAVGITTEISVFEGTVATDCCSSFTVANANADCGCVDNPPVVKYRIAHGGSAFVTPCC